MTGAIDLTTLSSAGVVVVRSLLGRAAAYRIGRRIEANLDRLRDVFPDYRSDASRNVFSLALAFCEGDDSLPERMCAALETGRFMNPDCISPDELGRFYGEVVGPILGSNLRGFGLAGLDNAYCRYESARPNSPYGSYFLHQDGGLGLNPRGLTVWIALSPCGADAPSLQFVARKHHGVLPTAHPGAFHLDPQQWPAELFERPIYEPGDAVIFDAFTVHGTYITPEMSLPRTSLDVRLSPL